MSGADAIRKFVARRISLGDAALAVTWLRVADPEAYCALRSAVLGAIHRIVAGDVHGAATALDALLERLLRARDRCWAEFSGARPPGMPDPRWWLRLAGEDGPVAHALRPDGEELRGALVTPLTPFEAELREMFDGSVEELPAENLVVPIKELIGLEKWTRTLCRGRTRVQEGTFKVKGKARPKSRTGPRAIRRAARDLFDGQALHATTVAAEMGVGITSARRALHELWLSGGYTRHHDIEKGEYAYTLKATGQGASTCSEPKPSRRSAPMADGLPLFSILNGTPPGPEWVERHSRNT